jgi:hypothetical protein
MSYEFARNAIADGIILKKQEAHEWESLEAMSEKPDLK